MAFIMCDDHNLSVEADGIDAKLARQLMIEGKIEGKPILSAGEKEVIEFGAGHRNCNIRIMAD